MTLFRRLINASNNVQGLHQFISENIKLFDALHNNGITILEREKTGIRDFIETKRFLLEELDYSFSANRSFISMLFDFTERFGMLSIVGIENTLVRKELYLGDRRQAAKLFLLNIRNNNEYLTRFESICNLLQSSYINEEDTDRNIIATFLNYAGKIIRDTSLKYANLFKELIATTKSDNRFDFLQHNAIEQFLQIDLSDLEQADSKIQVLIDEVLGRNFLIAPPVVPAAKYFIENGTEYSNLLYDNQVSLDSIRNIAVEKCRTISTVLHGRGVVPLRSEDELYVYLYRYGKMHKAKLNVCFNSMPFNEINGSVQVIDWGCGQGLASVALNDYILQKGIKININAVTLIEPSILSLERAALHVCKSIHPPILKTVCSSFNSLSHSDIITNNQSIKLHLLSNVLDIDEALYSQSHLINLIKNTQKGINYFICSSPYIDDVKTNRIDNFVEAFSKSNGFKLIAFVNKRKYEWINGWSKVTRVFKVTL